MWCCSYSITGQLGDVFKESAALANYYAKHFLMARDPTNKFFEVKKKKEKKKKEKKKKRKKEKRNPNIRNSLNGKEKAQ